MSFMDELILKHHIFLQVVGSIMLLAFGIYTFRSNPVKSLRPASGTRGTYLHNFVTAFFVTLSNPLIIFLFIGLFARFSFVMPGSPIGFQLVGYLAIITGALGWWFSITYFVNKVRSRFNLRGIWVLNRIIGVVVMIAAVVGKNIIEPYPATDEQKQELARWYEDLINMMQQEGVMEKGHLQINKNVIVWLTDLHLRLLRSPKFPYYTAAYYKVLPFIVELRAKGGDKDVPELETCFDAMYGVLMLKLQKKEISEGTAKAVKAISDLLAMLAGYYIKDKEGDLDLD